MRYPYKVGGFHVQGYFCIQISVDASHALIWKHGDQFNVGVEWNSLSWRWRELGRESLRCFQCELGFVMCSVLMSKDPFHRQQMGVRLYPSNLSKDAATAPFLLHEPLICQICGHASPSNMSYKITNRPDRELRQFPGHSHETPA